LNITASSSYSWGVQKWQRSTYPKFNIHSIINFDAARFAANSLDIFSYCRVLPWLSLNPLSYIKNAPR
jgi:hypothetical protein